jgi:predicted kinase
MDWERIRHAQQSEIIAWAERQPWAKGMAACAQDLQWHAEGDVWTHTKMVCDQLSGVEGWGETSDDDRLSLLLTALLHDSAKPITSMLDPETGHIRSPNHAVKGEHVARSILRELGCDLKQRERICSMVRYHGRPAFLLERQNPERELIRLSWLSNNRLLYLFSIADTRGRDTDSMQRPEENLHYWRLLAEEIGCFDDSFPFATDQSRLVYFESDDPNLYYVPHESFSARVTMISGLPGSGKDTWLAKHRSELPVISLDDLRRELDVDPTDDQGRVIQLASERCREKLRAGQSFAFNATNLLRQTRSRWLSLFADYNAWVELVYVEPPLKHILKQNRDRKYDVPESVILKLAAKVEPPNWLEAHRLVLV